MAGQAIIGWDMTAALMMGEALGIPARAVVELLPAIEAAMLRAAKGKIEQGRMDGD